MSASLQNEMGSTLTLAASQIMSPTNNAARSPQARVSSLHHDMIPMEHVKRNDMVIKPVPRDTLSKFVEGGPRIWRDTGGLLKNVSHLEIDMRPMAMFDAGIGCEGYYTNGLPEHYVRPDRKSQMKGASMRPLSGANEWEAGWYTGMRGKNFSLPVVHHKRPEVDRCQSEPELVKYEDIDFKPAPRARAVPRDLRPTVTGTILSPEESSRWTTSYDTTFSPMNERELALKKKKDALKAAAKSNKKKKRVFDWRRRPRKTQNQGQKQGKPVWRGGAQKDPQRRTQPSTR